MKVIIENLIDAVRCCLAADTAGWNTAYNISNGSPIAIKTWLGEMLGICDRPFNPKTVPLALARGVAAAAEFASRLPFGPKQPSMTRFSVGYMARSMTLSIEKARRQIGYEPRFDNRSSFDHYKRQRHRQCNPTQRRQT
jgi:nucleoside-diphosphate-sugar epimerase